MKIILTIPSLKVPHGGTRVILEWANWFSRNHEVYLFCRKGCKCNWFSISNKVTIFNDEKLLRNGDCLIVCSPHDVNLLKSKWAPGKKFIFLQMLEHMFSNSIEWRSKCKKVYQSDVPIFLISQWNKRTIDKDSPNNRKVFYIGNGVNLKDFPIEPNINKSEKVVLVEGWNCFNPTKDIDHLGAKVSYRLKKMGFKVLAYSQKPIMHHKHVPDEFYVCPSLDKLNDLYRRATVLIKASLYDARSCSPMEAMTKGTVTARSIVEGDDDLIHLSNCLKVKYNEDALFEACLNLFQDKRLRKELSKNCLSYVQTFTWDYWLSIVEDIIR